jgi:hypothetical protein
MNLSLRNSATPFSERGRDFRLLMIEQDVRGGEQHLWVVDDNITILGAAAQYLALWPEGMLEKVYFLAYTDQDRSVCRSAFIRLGLAEVRAGLGFLHRALSGTSA